MTRSVADIGSGAVGLQLLAEEVGKRANDRVAASSVLA